MNDPLTRRHFFEGRRQRQKMRGEVPLQQMSSNKCRILLFSLAKTNGAYYLANRNKILRRMLLGQTKQ